MSRGDSTLPPFERAAQAVVEQGNRMMDEDAEAEVWEIASGMLAGAIQFWLYSREPCGDLFCQDCAEIATAEQRLTLLLSETKRLAEESDYFHSPNDSNVGTA